MTAYGAYDRGLPCKNSACKSHGQGHPNCQCYPGLMAKGGVVKRFCDDSRPHEMGCEYYAEGGEVGTPQVDHHHAVSGYLAKHGLHGLINMHPDLNRYEKSVKQGNKYLDSEVGRVFENGKAKTEDRSKEREAIHDWISKGGASNDIQEKSILFNHPIESAHPEQAALLGAIKGRASQYLTSLHPKEHTPKLAFDEKPDNTEQKKTYERALKLAAHPAGILDHVQKGTIEPELIKHMSAMYSEFSDVLQKKLTAQITKDQMEDKKPHYKVRQGLSLMMGTPLSGEMTPQNIMAAQASFQRSQPQSPGQDGAPQKKTSAIGKANQSYMTADQAAASRQQKQ